MTAHKTPPVNVDGISSLTAVLAELRTLDDKLDALQLDQFRLFNKAYYVLTSRVRQAIENDYFQTPRL